MRPITFVRRCEALNDGEITTSNFDNLKAKDIMLRLILTVFVYYYYAEKCPLMLSQGYHSNINDVALTVSKLANLKTKEMMFCLFLGRDNRHMNLQGQCCFALSVGHALSQPGH